MSRASLEKQPHEVAAMFDGVARQERNGRAGEVADLQHAQRQVHPDDVGAGAGQFLSGHTGAGGQVEAALAGPELERGPGGPAPRPVPAEGEDRVGAVVPAGDTVEHRRHLVRLLVQRGAAHDVATRGRVRPAGMAIDEKCERTRSSVGSSSGVQCTLRCR